MNRRGDHSRSGSVIAVATGVVLLMLMLVVVGATRWNNQADKLAKANEKLERQGEAILAVQAQQARDRVEAQQADCHQRNEQIAKQREAFRQSVLVAVPQDSSSDPRIAEFLDGYLQAVNTNLPFRNCSTKGIVEYFANPPEPTPCPEPDGKGYCK